MRKKLSDHLNERLRKGVMELAATNRQLRDGLFEHGRASTHARSRGVNLGLWLKDSLRMREVLRLLARHALGLNNEDDKNSAGLQDEVMQILAGLDLRARTLKQEARVNTSRLKKDIANARGLVLQSSRSMRRVGREIGIIEYRGKGKIRIRE